MEEIEEVVKQAPAEIVKSTIVYLNKFGDIYKKTINTLTNAVESGSCNERTVEIANDTRDLAELAEDTDHPF